MGQGRFRAVLISVLIASRRDSRFGPTPMGNRLLEADAAANAGPPVQMVP